MSMHWYALVGDCVSRAFFFLLNPSKPYANHRQEKQGPFFLPSARLTPMDLFFASPTKFNFVGLGLDWI